MSNVECRDHLGNVYSSIKDMCSFYNIDSSTVSGRLDRGWSLENALTTPPHTLSSHVYKQRFVVSDHLGNTFANNTVMCEHYGISRRLLSYRLSHGYSLKDALTEPVVKYTDVLQPDGNQLYSDHLGNKFSTVKEMAEFHGVYVRTLYRRLADGLSLEQALTYKPNVCEDHLGNVFNSVAEMCRFYNVPDKIYLQRVNTLHWSVEDALSKPVYRGITCCDHLGNQFESYRAMCRHYHIARQLYERRIAEGWSVAEALTLPKHMYIGEYRVAECLKRLNVLFYHDCSIKVLFEKLNISVDWDTFLKEFQQRLSTAGFRWSKAKIEKLRPDFVLYEDTVNNIRGVIEFDGKQHQNFVEFFCRTMNVFYERVSYDCVKQTLWEYLGIPMLRIRYDQVNMIDEMVTDFVQCSSRYIYNHNTYLSEDEYWSVLKEQKAVLDSVFA